MPAMTLGNGSIIVDDELQRQANAIIESVDDHDIDAITIRVSGQDITAGPELAKFITTLLENVARGGQTNVQTLPSELTTTSAAGILGVSRPTLLKFVRANELRSRKVGTHTRVMTEDVLQLRELRLVNERQAALEELRRASEDLDLD